jgi:hypothetical protein
VMFHWVWCISRGAFVGTNDNAILFSLVVCGILPFHWCRMWSKSVAQSTDSIEYFVALAAKSCFFSPFRVNWCARLIVL